jgi:acetyltransferase-like isoleucine patch superfamily enzyme
MRQLLKKISNGLTFIPFFRKYHHEWKLLGRVSFGLLIANNVFKKIFRINSKVKFPIHFTSRIIAPQNLKYSNDPTTVGSFVLSGGTYFQALNGIELGQNFLFAPGVKLISSNHGMDDRHIIEKAEPIRIGNNVWLGANVVILPGVQLGNNIVVGAGSVVTKSFPDNVVIAGNPAKVLSTKSEVKS